MHELQLVCLCPFLKQAAYLTSELKSYMELHHVFDESHNKIDGTCSSAFVENVPNKNKACISFKPDVFVL